MSTHSLPFVAIVLPLTKIPLHLSSPFVHFIRSKFTRGVRGACQTESDQARVARKISGRWEAPPANVRKKGAA